MRGWKQHGGKKEEKKLQVSYVTYYDGNIFKINFKLNAIILDMKEQHLLGTNYTQPESV